MTNLKVLALYCGADAVVGGETRDGRSSKSRNRLPAPQYTPNTNCTSAWVSQRTKLVTAIANATPQTTGRAEIQALRAFQRMR